MTWAQPNFTAGELQGLVTDPSGASVPAAKVSVRSAVTGASLATLTDESGEYRFLSLQPGEYELQVERDGFRKQVITGVRVMVGQTAGLPVRLALGVNTETVEVIGETALIETGRSHQANNIEEEAIRNLPIDRRDYLTYTLLAPGVVDATALADNADFRPKQTPSSGLSFFGSNGRNNYVSVDGGEVNDNTGGVRATVSQEAVQEFQINRANYSAEFGGATGAVINIVTRTGTNALHGSLFGFFRDDALDAANPFARVLEGERVTRIKPHSTRQQFGFAAGGPVRKDRTFFFVAGEGLIRNESVATSLLTDRSIFGPTTAQLAAIAQLPAQTGEALRNLLTSPPATISLFERNSGVFAYPSHDWKTSVRLDHYSTGGSRLFFRFSYAHLREQNANLQALVGASRGSDLLSYDPTTLVGWTRTFNPRLVNELQAQWAYHRLIADTVEKFGPEIRIQGFGTFNRDFLLPARELDRNYEIKDNVTWIRGSHTLKFGGQDVIRGTSAENHVLLGGRFAFGDLPGSVLGIPGLPSTFTLNGLQAFNLGLAQSFLFGTGNPAVAATHPYYGVYAQDTWKALPGLTIDLGLRYELDTRVSPVPNDYNNFAPRIGFAWDPFGDQKTSVRGGYGIFYAPLQYYIDWGRRALGTVNGYRQIAYLTTTLLDPGPANAANIFTTLRNQGILGIPTPIRPLAAADLAQFGLVFSHTGPLPPFSVPIEVARDLVNSYSQQASLSIERQVGRDWAVSVEGDYVRTLKIPRLRDRNLLPAPIDPTLGIRVWNSPQYFVDPLLGSNGIFEPSGRAFYSGLIVEVRKRMRRSLSFNANYTFSKATDEVTDYNIDYESFDQTDQRADRSLSSFDQRHKVVAYALWRSPGDFEFTPIFRANSGRPFNLLAGFDLNQDRHDTSDRPAGAGRNTGLGPGFWTFDLRLARAVAAGENFRAEFTAEAFNLFNRLNYSSINNVVGNISGPFDLRGRKDRGPSEPLGFSSAYDPRRIQLGIRLRF
jgi:hypothetical protein